MFSIIVERRFHADHALRFPDGTAEPLHGHEWVVRVHVARTDSGLDDLECVVDFHDIERELDDVLTLWRGQSLNEIEPFVSKVNPTAERVAEQIAKSLNLSTDLRLQRVEVTEAEGCIAVFERSPLR